MTLKSCYSIIASLSTHYQKKVDHSENLVEVARKEGCGGVRASYPRRQSDLAFDWSRSWTWRLLWASPSPSFMFSPQYFQLLFIVIATFSSDAIQLLFTSQTRVPHSFLIFTYQNVFFVSFHPSQPFALTHYQLCFCLLLLWLSEAHTVIDGDYFTLFCVPSTRYSRQQLEATPAEILRPLYLQRTTENGANETRIWENFPLLPCPFVDDTRTRVWSSKSKQDKRSSAADS